MAASLRLSLVLAALAGASSPAAAAAPGAPDLDALVTYETRQVLASGVIRQERWQERMVRRGDTVWTERVLPPSAVASHRHESPARHAEHKHFDFEAASRLVSRDARGDTSLRYVDRKNRMVVSVPRAEYGAVGFDGRWDAAASLVPPVVASAMAPATGPAGERGSRWLADRASAWTHKVLWSDARGVALVVESERDDGSFRRRVTLLPTPARSASSLPWLGLDAFAQKEYDDFMD